MFFAESLFPGAVGLEYTHGDSMKIGLLYFGPNDEFEEPIGGWHNMLNQYMVVYGLASIGSTASAKVDGDYTESKEKPQSKFK